LQRLEAAVTPVDLRSGARLKSIVCDTQVLVIRAPSSPVDVCCGGSVMVGAEDDTPTGFAVGPAHDGGTILGKRYADPDSGLEVLCTKTGAGSLSVGGRLLRPKEAKPLPSSD
jgi:hypothetical protein